MAKCSGRTTCIWAYGTGLTLIGLSVALIIGWPFLYDYIHKSNFVLTEGSEMYDQWREAPIPIYMEFYLYNLTNAEEVQNAWKLKNSTVKLQYEQKGPYVFVEKHERVKVRFHNNGTVTFRQTRKWYFESSLTKGSLDDVITNFNMIPITVGFIIRHSHPLAHTSIDFLFKRLNEPLFVSHTANEWLFEGFSDPILNLTQKINITGFDVPFTKFAWFKDRNGSETYDGIFNMFTGENDFDKLGEVYTWNDFRETPYYDSPCNKVQGTSGEVLPSLRGKDSFKVFATDFCSYVQNVRVKDVSMHGIDGARFVPEVSTFDNGTKHPEKACFCRGQVVPSGTRNVSDCYYNAPAFVSFPHFYLADKSYLEPLEGLRPSQEEDEFRVEVEPYTGVPFKIRAQLQINLLLSSDPLIELLKDVPSVFVPMFWFRQRAELSEDLARQLKIFLFLPVLGDIISGCFFAVGLIVLSVALVVSYKKCW